MIFFMPYLSFVIVNKNTLKVFAAVAVVFQRNEQYRSGNHSFSTKSTSKNISHSGNKSAMNKIGASIQIIA